MFDAGPSPGNAASVVGGSVRLEQEIGSGRSLGFRV